MSSTIQDMKRGSANTDPVACAINASLEENLRGFSDELVAATKSAVSSQSNGAQLQFLTGTLTKEIDSLVHHITWLQQHYLRCSSTPLYATIIRHLGHKLGILSWRPAPNRAEKEYTAQHGAVLEQVGYVLDRLQREADVHKGHLSDLYSDRHSQELAVVQHTFLVFVCIQANLRTHSPTIDCDRVALLRSRPLDEQLTLLPMNELTGPCLVLDFRIKREPDEHYDAFVDLLLLTDRLETFSRLVRDVAVTHSLSTEVLKTAWNAELDRLDHVARRLCWFVTRDEWDELKRAYEAEDKERTYTIPLPEFVFYEKGKLKGST